MKSKLKYIFTLLLGFGYYNSNSQNLITNGSFENYTSPIDCGAGGFDNYSTFPVNHVVDNWYGYQSPDYYNSFCNPGGFNVPNSYFGYSNAKNGNAYIGIVTYVKGGYLKEYIYQQLSQPLQASKVYCLSFYVTRTDRFPYAIKNIGAYFSSGLPVTANCCEINVTPQVSNASGFISDTIQWTQIQGCFTASGGEQYITIGNFTPNASTDTLNVGTNNQIINGENESYYYIDDITLIDQSTVGIIEFDTENNFVIYPNPALDILYVTIKNKSIKENTQIKLYNVLEENVLTENLIYQNTSLKINHLQSGIYYLNILMNNKIIKTEKLIITK